ncbi:MULTISPECIES: DUF4917 family protein [Acinetobacter]|uniref:DUF4917 family protein n=1 Tax=Acinetobacter TaxID=469 RepID=UPI00257B1BED|nr:MULTISPECIES: DUF4917 family protein [Acinetobacter]
MADSFEYPIKEWAEIKDDYENGNLIIGNGASVALHQKFRFDSLKEEAEKLKLFNEDISKLFIEFDTCDFELILRLVWHAKLVNKHLGIIDPKIDSAYKNIKNALLEVVKEVHCEHAEIFDQLPQLYQFTKRFRTIVSLNYDLILHSIRMYGNDAIKDDHVFKDGFSDDGVIFNRWDYLKDPYYKSSYEKEVTRTFYQHGNLSIFRFANGIERKVKRKFNSDLLETIEENWTDQSIPIFVAEGTSDKKMDSIKSSHYLSKVYYEVLPEFLNDGKNLVIYGWGIEVQELHLVDQVFKGKFDGKFAISVFENNQDYCHRVERLINKINSNIKVEFFDSQSSGCWNNA